MNMEPYPVVITDEKIQILNEYKSIEIDLRKEDEMMKQVKIEIAKEYDDLLLNNQIRNIKRSAKKTPEQKQIKIFGGLYQPTRNERP